MAKDEWWRIAEELHGLGLLTALDVNPLAAYCQSFARWRVAEELLAKMAERDPTTGGMLIRNQIGGARQNPLLKIAVQAASEMLRYAGEFGLTPVARSRIATSPSGKAGKFDGLLNG